MQELYANQLVKQQQLVEKHTTKDAIAVLQAVVASMLGVLAPPFEKRKSLTAVGRAEH